MVVRSTNVGTAPVEDMQALSITALSASEVEQQYELIGPLGKGTYGRVDLVAHRTQGECVCVGCACRVPNVIMPVARVRMVGVYGIHNF